MGDVTPPDAPGPQVERQAIENLLDLYSEALVNEDIDRLQAVLASAASGASTQTRAAATFRQNMSDSFRQRTILAHELQDVTIADDRLSATGLEVLSSLDPERLVQQTEVFHTTFSLARQPEGEVIHFRIAAVKRDAPLVEVSTPGLLVAGPPSPITLRAASGQFSLVSAEVTTPEGNPGTSLDITDQQAIGTFIAQRGTGLHSLPIQARSTDGDLLSFNHYYRLHQTQEGIAQRVSGTEDTRFFAVTVTANGTVWAGGDGGARLYQIAPNSNSAQQVGTLLEDPTGRVQDLAIDSLGRLHAIVFSAQKSGDIVLDQGVFCQTVNASDPDYPFEVLDLSANTVKPSPSTRLLTASDGNVWLFGSDGGVAQVSDSFRQGQCMDNGVSVIYDPLYQRQSSDLPTNTVPAFIAGPDGARWFGTALGLVRLQNGTFTQVPFQKPFTISGDIETLEGLFARIAQAIFEATPIDTLTVGGLSVSDILGTTLSKEDFIFSAVQDSQGAIWAGTLGGGLRRIEMVDGVPKDTLHLTREDGLSSNLVLSLTLGPDSILWVGTDEGVSLIDTTQAPPAITTLTALEGIPGPVRDIAVDAEGTVWLATDNGLFRLHGSGRSDPATPTAGRLIRVSGNNQNALPGEELPTPLVVRLENQIGEPVPDATVRARIIRGDATFVSASTLTTDAQGKVQFRVQASSSDTDLAVEVTAPERDVLPVKFFATIGEVDVPNLPTDIALSSDIAFIPARGGGLQIIDVQDPVRPVRLHTDNPFQVPNAEWLAAVRGNRLYLATIASTAFYVIDITEPRAPGFPMSTTGTGAPSTTGTGGRLPDVVVGGVVFPNTLQGQTPRAMVVRDDVAYMVEDANTADTARLHVIDIRDETRPRLVTSVALPGRRARGMAWRGSVLYVAAGEAGLLVFDLHDPLQPVLVKSVAGDLDPDDDLDLFLPAHLTIAGAFAYGIQTRVNRNSGLQTDLLAVFDLRDPLAPRLRGTAPLRVATAESSTLSVYSGTGIAVSNGFAYLPRSALGVQVVDVRHPDAPHLVSVLDTPSQALQIATANDLIYVVDSVFGLQVIQGPGKDLSDYDGDGVIDFFDRFPADASEFQDSDGDGVGDVADPDEDNDGVSDADEQRANPPTDPLDALSFPVTPPPEQLPSLVVDAAVTLPLSARNGTPEAPYRSITEALQVIRSGQASRVSEIVVRAGTYSTATTKERFPLDFSGLSQLTLQGAGRESTILDAGFVDDVITAERASHLVIEGVTLTRGVHGIEMSRSTAIALRLSRSTGNAFDGARFTGSGNVDVLDTLLDHNGEDGLSLLVNVTGTVRDNTMRDNADDGMDVGLGAHADISGNLIEANVTPGITVFSNASARISGNTVHDNQSFGIYSYGNSTVEITDNTITDNRQWGVFCSDTTTTVSDNTLARNWDGVAIVRSMATVSRNSIIEDLIGIFLYSQASAEILDNSIAAAHTGVYLTRDSAATMRRNVLTADSIGLLVEGQGSSVVLHSGDFTGAAYAGVEVIGGGELSMGLDDQDDLRIAQNRGVGLLVADDASQVALHRDRIRFEDNGGGDVKGPVIDVADEDGDGISRAAELNVGTDPAVADTDGDGLLDGFELRYGFDPLTPGDGSTDPDGDGLSNAAEQDAGSDPRNPDTDGDGLPDGAEINIHGTDALRPDSDGDGLEDGSEIQVHGTDATRADSDGDGVGDGEEVLLTGLNPLDPGDGATVIDLVIDGGFEAEGGSLTGWTQLNRVPSGPGGGWFAQSDVVSEKRQLQVPAPPEGMTAAIADALGQNSLLILSQEITIPPATSVVLSVDLMLTSGVPFVDSEAFDLEPGLPLNHQFRIDLLAAGAPILAVGDEVLAPLFRTQAGDPPHTGYRRLLFNLTPYAGQRVVLRFAHNQALFGMVSGIDNVRLLVSGVSP